MAYVYKHIRKDNNQPFYIGVGGLLSFDNYQRANSNNWRGLRDRSDFWNNTVNKYGFIVEIALDNCTRKEAFEKEIELISLHGRQDIDTGILVNHTAGGDGRVGSSIEIKNKCGVKNIGRVWTESHRAKVMEKRKNRLPDSEETRLRKSIGSKGKPKSKEHIEKIKELSIFKKGHTPWNKGLTYNANTRKVIDTSTGIRYSSCRYAAKCLGINEWTLSAQLRNKNPNKTTLRYE